MYPVGAHVAWDSRGFGYQLGFVDFAGSGVVHAAGGIMGLIATLQLGPRRGVFSESGAYFPVRSSPTTAVLGVFILIWCWFSFNAGSTASVSGNADKVAALAAVNTAMGSAAGSVSGMVFSWVRSRGKYIDVYETSNGALCGLVGITAACASVQPGEALAIGALVSLAGNAVTGLLVQLRIDDPVGVVPVHLVSGVLGVLAVGLCANDPSSLPDLPVPQGRAGLFHGGGFELLGVQALIMLFLLAWGLIVFGAFTIAVDAAMGIRVSAEEESMLDALEHNLLMVKVQETFGYSAESDEGDGAEASDEGGGAEASAKPVTRRRLSDGQVVTLDAGLTRPDDHTDAGGAIDRGAAAPGSTAAAMTAMAAAAKPAGVSSGPSRRSGRRRRSLVYHKDEVAFVTAEELAAAHTGLMDDTEVDRALPSAISQRVSGASQAERQGSSAELATTSAEVVTTASAEMAATSSAEMAASPSAEVVTTPSAELEDLDSPDDAKATAGGTSSGAGASATAGGRLKASPTVGPHHTVVIEAGGEAREAAGERPPAQRSSKRRLAKRVGSKSSIPVLEATGWQAPGAVGGLQRVPSASAPRAQGVDSTCQHQ